MASESVLLQYTIVLSLATFCSLADKPFLEHDEMIRRIVLEPSHEIKRRSTDQPLRISLDFLDIHKLENPTIVKDILREAQEYFKNTLTVRKTTSKILLQRSCSDKLFFMKNANGTRPGKVRFCHEACNSSRILCGPIEIPEHDLDQCRICDQNGQNCQNDTRPGYTAGEGHNDTDFILYVTAVADGNCNSITTLAYGSACQQESSLDRPVVGFINICPEKVTADELRISYSEVLATIKHEIFHALGLAPSLYAFYRNQNGDPLTPRSSYGLPATKYDRVLKHYKWSEETAKEVTRTDWVTRTGAVHHNVHIMVTPRVKEEAQKHFNCSTLEGAELENQGGEGTALAHWEKRLFGNEGMTGVFTQNSVFSRLTLALMEDTGWYKVDYNMAESLQWGKNLGCLFAKNSCGAWMMAQKDAGKTMAPFCNSIKKNSNSKSSCSVDKTSVASCNLVKYDQQLPGDFQNFFAGSIPGVTGSEENYGGSIALADYCPYYQAFTWTKQGKDVRTSSCILHHNNLEQDKNYALESYGSNSRCFEQLGKWTRKNCGVRWTATNWGSGCYKYLCELDSLKIEILGYKFKCFHKGQHINVSVQENDWEYHGVLICPSCQEVCHDSRFICPKEIKPAPQNSQPVPKISPVACCQCSMFQQSLGLAMLLILVYKFTV